MSDERALNPPPRLKDRYRLLAPLGQGSMAVVYRAHDEMLARDVAIKFLAPNRVLADEVSARFMREARTIARLIHANIMTLYDVDREANWHYLVLEHIDGRDLHRELAQGGGKLTVDEALRITHGVLAGLGYAHEQGVIHRDIKPGNIMLTAAGDVKLTDFGLALTQDEVRLTQEGMILGTLLYMAPEALSNKPVDRRTDLYAVGVILYEMLTGRVPYSGDSMMAIASQILHAPLTAPRTLNARIPPALEDVITTLLARDPADRFGSAGDVLAALPDTQPVPLAQSHAMTPDLRLYAALEDKAAALENERRRFAEQLGRSVLQSLDLLQAQISAYQATQQGAPQMAFSVLASLVRQAIQQTRDLETNLHPEVLDMLGLEPALEALAEQMRRAHGLGVTLDLPRLDDRLPPPLELALLRITQDAFERTVYHARAAQVTIALARDARELRYSYHDNGTLTTGIDLLNSGRERVEQLGGSVQMAVNAAQGFALEVGFPLLPPADLTPRELDVLQLVAQGLTNKAIAQALGISPRTVNFHLDNVYSKLGVNSRTEAAILALRQGLAAPLDSASGHPG